MADNGCTSCIMSKNIRSWESMTHSRVDHDIMSHLQALEGTTPVVCMAWSDNTWQPGKLKSYNAEELNNVVVRVASFSVIEPIAQRQTEPLSKILVPISEIYPSCKSKPCAFTLASFPYIIHVSRFPFLAEKSGEQESHPWHVTCLDVSWFSCVPPGPSVPLAHSQVFIGAG